MGRRGGFNAVRCAAVTVATTAVLAGCGGKSGVRPGVYVNAVCPAITSWRNHEQAAAAQFEGSFPKSASLDVAKQRLTGFLAALLRSATAGITATRAASFPDVNGGQRLAASLVDAFENAQRSLSQAASEAMLIPTSGNQAFAAGVEQVRATIATTVAAMNSVSPGTNPVLRREIAKQPACASLRLAG